jgi:hypothetical protein
MGVNINRLHKIVTAAVVVVLLGLSLFSAFAGYKMASESSQGLNGDDMVTAWDKRQRKVRQLLPDYGIVGYLADWDIPGAKYGSSDQEVEFLLMQYTIAPVVLERGADHELVLGNFSDNGDPNKIDNVQKIFGVSLIQSYSNEVFLFKGAKK